MNQQQKDIASLVRTAMPDGEYMYGSVFVDLLADYYAQNDQHKDCVDSAKYPCHGIKFDRVAFVDACYKESE